MLNFNRPLVPNYKSNLNPNPSLTTNFNVSSTPLFSLEEYAQNFIQNMGAKTIAKYQNLSLADSFDDSFSSAIGDQQMSVNVASSEVNVQNIKLDDTILNFETGTLTLS